MNHKNGTELSGVVMITPVQKRPLHKRLQGSKFDNTSVVEVDNVLSEQLVSEEEKEQEIKQAIADKKGVAVTSEEHAVEFEKQTKDLKDKSPEEIESVLEEMEAKAGQELERNVRIAKQAVVTQERQKLIDKIQIEIEKEIERAKLLYLLENARKNAIDAARAQYGAKANIGSIQQAYDGMANNIDPKLTDVTDMISMSIDNKLHGKECVRMLMPNGSIRMMDADVAFALSEIPKHHVNKSAEQIEATKEVAMEPPNPMFSAEEIEKLRELSDIMDDNAKRQAAFAYKDPKSGEVEIKSQREQRLRALGLPTVAMDYDYVYHLDETSYHNGRQLPSAMDSYSMQVGMQNSGKTYGFYK